MYLLRGIPISKGIAIGNILIRYDVTKMIRFYTIEESHKEDEIARYMQAVNDVRAEIESLNIENGSQMNRDHD